MEESNITNLRDSLVSFMHGLEKASTARSDFPLDKISTGFNKLDRDVSLGKNETLVVLGSSGTGKTSLVLTFLHNHIFGEKNNKSLKYLFLTEQNSELITRHLVSASTRIDASRLKVGKLADRDWPRLAESADKLAKTNENIDIASIFLPWPDLKKYDVVIIDSFTFVKNKNLRELRESTDALLIITANTSDWLNQRPNKRPTLRDFRPEDNDLKHLADCVLGIYRDEVYNSETEDKGIGEIIILKNRDGELDTISVAFMSEYCLFANLCLSAPPSMQEKKNDKF